MDALSAQTGSVERDRRQASGTLTHFSVVLLFLFLLFRGGKGEKGASATKHHKERKLTK